MARVGSAVGSAVGSGSVAGRFRPTLDEVSNLTFDHVIGYKRHPEWDMIDLSPPYGKFQVHAEGDDLELVERYVLDRVPRLARKAPE